MGPAGKVIRDLTIKINPIQSNGIAMFVCDYINKTTMLKNVLNR